MSLAGTKQLLYTSIRQTTRLMGFSSCRNQSIKPLMLYLATTNKMACEHTSNLYLRTNDSTRHLTIVYMHAHTNVHKLVHAQLSLPGCTLFSHHHHHRCQLKIAQPFAIPHNSDLKCFEKVALEFAHSHSVSYVRLFV